MARGSTVTIPEEIDVAIRAEAYRLGCRPGEVLVRWLRATFPEFVRDQLHQDLRHPKRHIVIDVVCTTSEQETPVGARERLSRSTDFERNHDPELSPGVRGGEVSTRNADAILGRGLHEGASGGG